MASIGTQIELYDAITSPLMNITSALNMTISSFEEMQSAANSSFDSSNFEGVREHINQATIEIEDMVQSINDAEQQQQNFNNSLNQGTHSAGGLERKLLGMVAAYASIRTVGEVFDLSDSMVQTEARLNLIVDDGGSVEQLQNKIFASAQNSRAAYADTADMVAKLGMQAGHAFGSNDELIAFSEQLNKNFVIAGTHTQGINAVMLQLTQAMASGTLRGEELNSVLDNATPIVQNIQKYLEEVMNIDASNIKQLAADGVLTAEVVKNAMFYAADETNAKFEEMPITFAQVWQGIQNDLLMTFQPLLQYIGAGAGWIHDNWSTLEPIFWGLTAAVGAYAIGLGIQTAATWIATGAAKAFFTTLMSNPLFWIALAIGVVIGAIYNWVQSVGGIEIAWKIAMNGIMTTWDWVQIGFFTGVYWVMDLWDKMTLGMMTASIGIQNYMGDMKVGVLNTLQDMANGSLDIINDFIGILNKIPGVSIETIQQVTFGTTAQLQNEADRIARQNELQSYQDEIQARILDRDAVITQMKNDALYSTAERQAEIDMMQVQVTTTNDEIDYDDIVSGFGSIPSNINDIANNTGAMKDSMNMSSEDLKYLRDSAAREVIDRTILRDIKVDMTGMQNIVNNEMDLDGVISYLGEGIEEQIEIITEGVHE